MSISEFITTTTPRPKQLVLSGSLPSDRAVETIRDFLDIPSYRVVQAAEHPAIPIGRNRATLEPADSIVSVYRESERLLTVDVERLRTAVTSEAEVIHTSGEGSGPTALIERIGENTFETANGTQLIVASRLIERKAHRVGGELHACFQRLSRLGGDLRTLAQYNLLASTGTVVHVYGLEDHSLERLEDATVHGGRSEELESSWLVAYSEDPTREDADAGALLAQENNPGTYAGYWTFDPAAVADVIGYMTDSY